MRGERTNDVYRYLVKENKWELVRPFSGAQPCPRAGHSCVAYNDSIFVFGGKDEDNNKLSDFWEFNLITAKWTQIPNNDQVKPRSGHTAVIYKEFMVIFGGIIEITHELNDLVMFDFKG